ncbi:hypothetical protein ILUMI_20158 [Ignelater luminosus]|uniref:Peptidase M13 N-terminal domain-containing protein n=1 Tax=Ignelater luminosus TaxID=2038154 RepID=A0A8K0CLG9_IGNLU|nr:hypothetical protein ILUMI_20158 [Ignelater luminosus]
MPPVNSRGPSNKGCWKNRPKLKIALTILIPSILLLIIILLAVYIKSGGGFCNTDPCIQQTNKLKRGMNLDINPCDDFYQFVCGNVFKDSSRKNFYVETNETVNRDLLKLYKEEIKDSEHKMVKIAKGLFQKCLNVEDIEKDDLASIKDAIKDVGGWPVLDSENNKFDWVKATYTLRELGYPFSVFINVDVTRVLENKEKYYLKITIPEEVNEKNSEAVEIMVKVANLFGAKHQDLVQREMRDVHEFSQKVSFQHYGYKSRENYTVEQFQKEYEQRNYAPFNWLEFLNKLVGPQIAISPKDYVSIADPHSVRDWIKFISTTSERTVGNYMIWKVIQAQLPYLPQRIQNIMKYSTNSTREEFCLEQTNKRFLPSPIEVINTRNLLPDKERKQVQKIFLDIKSEFLSLLKKTNWMNGEDKRKVTENIKNLTLIYGLPGDYFSDGILDDMDVDLVQRKGNSFLDYLAQANRNYQTTIFKQITLPASKNTMSRMYLKSEGTFPFYYERAENEFFVATKFSYYLRSDTPMYFRYSSLGAIFHIYLIASLTEYDFEFGWLQQQLSQQTRNATEEIFRCVKNQTQKYNVSQMGIVGGLSVSTIERSTYIAYGKWIRSNGEEKLPGTSYTSPQLFWIAGTYCHIPSSHYDYPMFNDVNYYSNVTLVSRLINPFFARDFDCPAVKCPLL